MKLLNLKYKAQTIFETLFENGEFFGTLMIFHGLLNFFIDRRAAGSFLAYAYSLKISSQSDEINHHAFTNFPDSYAFRLKPNSSL
jgi:hypothetical protein